MKWKQIKNKIEWKGFTIFGTGFWAEIWYQRLGILGYKPLFFVDNNSTFWNEEIIDSVVCIPPNKIRELAGDRICLVCVSDKFASEIESQLEDEAIDYILMKDELAEEYDFICDYFNMTIPLYNEQPHSDAIANDLDMNQRIAVYTAIFGDYDELMQPKVIDSQCDYFCISDKEPKNIGIFKWIPLEVICDELIGNSALKNRYCKMLPHRIFPQYKYSIYVDGNIMIDYKLNHLLNKLGGRAMGFFDHINCNELYVEAFRFSDQYIAIENVDLIKKQVLEYCAVGFPFGFGFVENGVIIREHNVPSCISVMENWWLEYQKYTTRDQISFMYAVWKSGLSKNDIAIMGKNWRESEEFSYVNHKNQYQRVHRFFDKNNTQG